MPTKKIRAALFALALIPLVALLGCGPKRIKVSGTIILPASIKVKEQDAIQIVLAPEGEGEGPGASVSATDKTFTVKNALVGKYKVTLKITPYGGEKDAENRKEELQSFNSEFDRKNSKLTIEISSKAEQSFVIDFAKKEIKSE